MPILLLHIVVLLIFLLLAYVQLRRSRRRLSSLEQALSHTSHEIRTPLGGLVGTVSLLEETDLDSQQKELVSTLTESADSLMRVVNDALDASKLEAGRMRLDPKPFDLERTLHSVFRMFMGKARLRDTALELRFEPGQPRCYQGDPHRIRQVVSNLVGNAIKFSHGGRVTVSVRSESRQKDRRLVKIVVEDTGAGIPADQLDRIFDRYAQAGRAPDNTSVGTGLGLAICRQLVTHMRGSIRAESALGEGSRFTVTLPLTAVAGAPVESLDGARRTRASLEGKHVLLVEDCAINRRITERMLAKLGMRVTLVGDGSAAVESFCADPSDFVLMDCGIPGLDGYQATRAIRASVRGEAVSILGITADLSDQTRSRCLAAGMDDVLGKPFTLAVLQDSLRTRLDLSQRGPQDREPAQLTAD